jgi:hypothetical protein
MLMLTLALALTRARTLALALTWERTLALMLAQALPCLTVA